MVCQHRVRAKEIASLPQGLAFGEGRDSPALGANIWFREWEFCPKD